MQQVSNTYVLWRGVGGTISGLKMPHSIACGHWLIELVTCLLLALPLYAVAHLLMLLMVVFSALIVWVLLCYGLLSDDVLCCRSSLCLRCLTRYVCSIRMSLVVATYASRIHLDVMSYR